MCITCTILYNEPLNISRKYFVSKIFHAIKYNFWTNNPVSQYRYYCACIFVRFIFAQASLSKNILTTKYSRFTVCTYHPYHIVKVCNPGYYILYRIVSLSAKPAMRASKLMEMSSIPWSKRIWDTLWSVTCTTF